MEQNDLLSLITSRLTPESVDRIGSEIGASPERTASAIETALPLLLGGLARNANRSPEGSRSLAHALDRDHSPDLLDGLGSLLGGGGGGTGGLLGALLGGGSSQPDLGSVLGGLVGGGSRGKSLDGGGILGHVFGERRGAVEKGVGRASGLDSAQVGKLLMLLAPLVMSALAKMKQQRGLDDRGLAESLERQRIEVDRRTPGSGGVLTDLLDRDDDGSVIDDIAAIGARLGGSLLRGR